MSAISPAERRTLIELATEVFEDEQIADRWLLEPNAATDGRPPAELLDTVEGLSRVTNLLQRIEYGVLA